MAEKSEEEQEALRLTSLAEKKYNNSNLKSALKYVKRAHRLCPDLDGVAEMVTAFKILRVAAKAATTATATATAAETPDWYKILQVEPFSHINTIKSKYKKLALTLHPDKNSFVASEEAFKLVGEAFRVLSDKIRRKEYDMKLRIAMQSAATEASGGGTGETFWTACSACRLLHQFERRYLGHNLMCPNCKKGFKAVEVSGEVVDGEERVETRASVRVRRSVEAKQKMSSVGEVLQRSKPRRTERVRNVGVNMDSNSDGGVNVSLRSKRVERVRNAGVNGDSTSDGGVNVRLRSKRTKRVRNVGVNWGLNGDGGVKERLNSMRVERSRIVGKKEERSGGAKSLDDSKSKRVKIGEETMTLAEMQLLAKRKVQQKAKLKEKDSIDEKEKARGKKESRSSEIERPRGSKSRSLEIEEHERSKGEDLEIMAVEDSDFYNFDRDRVERSFKKGQVWAIYDDGDGMPRHYGLIDEVVSVNPFEVEMSWLDLQNNGDEELICWEKMGFHISFGRFKVVRKILIKSVNVFSHIVDCERAAREVYRIYPKKGSVWALYNENALDARGTNLLPKDGHCYDIVVFLTNYCEMHDLSMAYLEKVSGFRTVFKRREIGSHAIRWLEKDDVRSFSHQIPARKLSGEEASGLPRYCWELDPAALPPELLSISWER
ncbi:uncharacterized protein LOC132282499 [Cornus florida]|uniref:uncharacterized protein LOC132282499 n=1 Tax=Cornus florida TaxID=4283 RepID=UPI00289CB0D6|nr:uncharacterized protein LOC132282499 [Cornus florida]